MLTILTTLLLASPVTVHAEIPPAHRVEAEALLDQLGAAIERRTGEKPELTRHRDLEGPAGALRCAETLRLTLHARGVLFVRFVSEEDGTLTHAVAELVEGPGAKPERSVVRLASGPAVKLSIDAIAAALLPHRDRKLADLFEVVPVSDSKPGEDERVAEVQAPGTSSFELTVEFDGQAR